MSVRTRCRASPCPYRSDTPRAGATFWWYTRDRMTAVGARELASRRVTVSGPSPEAAVDALVRALDIEPTLVIAFASWQLDPDVTAGALARAFPRATVIGCTSTGEIGDGGDHEG